MSKSDTQSKESHDRFYRALVPFILSNFEDTPFTVDQLLKSTAGRLMVGTAEPGVSRPFHVPDKEWLRFRLVYLTSLAISSARWRVRHSLAHSDPNVMRLVTEGALYTTDDDMYVWDTGARWWYDDRTDEARLWNNALPHTPTVTNVSIARTGQTPGEKKGGGPVVPADARSIAPLSQLPPGTRKPAPTHTQRRVAQRSPEPVPSGPPAPAEAPHEEPAPTVLAPELLSNDGHAGGTLVLKVDGQVIVATIKAVA